MHFIPNLLDVLISQHFEDEYECFKTSPSWETDCSASMGMHTLKPRYRRL